MIRAHVLICGGTGCTSSEATIFKRRLPRILKAADLRTR